MAKPPMRFSGFVLLLLLHARALGPHGAAIFGPVESQVHGAVEQVGNDVLSFVDLFVVLGALRVQGTEMQSRLVFGALLGGQLLVAGEILLRLIATSPMAS